MFRIMTTSSKRRAIIDSAARIFDTEGYHATTVDALARAVGLKQPSLYHYFSGKDEILYWIHEEFIDLLITKQLAREAQDLPAPLALRSVIGDVLGLMDTHRGHVRVFFEHHRELSAERREAISAKRKRYATLVEAEIIRAIEAGDIRVVDPRLTALAMFGMCNWSYQWYRRDGSRTSAEIADFFWDLIFEGLRPRPEIARSGSSGRGRAAAHGRR
jgi:TetR/AcrR family transcriptional regulator, cholesterol catabolism regulator